MLAIEKCPLGRPRGKGDDIKMNLRETGCEVARIELFRRALITFKSQVGRP
jgi:hypothetical protein